MPESLETRDLDRLIALLRGDGYRVVGPTVRDGAIVYDDLDSAADLPVGWTDEQAPGRYRLRRRDDDAVFGYAVGPHSWKKLLFPARETLVQIRVTADGPVWRESVDDPQPVAFLGVRGCELAAIEIQDVVFRGGRYKDSAYGGRRDRVLIIAVNCTEAGDLCFCDSMGTGPRADGEFDLRLTELAGELLVESGSSRGQSILERLPTRPAASSQQAAADEAMASCRASMGRTLNTEGLPGLLMGNLRHERWDELAERCLACGNCTLVCPTCFCFNLTEESDLAAEVSHRNRSWDSCFTADHSYIHGAQFRPDVKLRFRQWLTHKLATWDSQFGSSGCVGCGRCIAWCPVGIDITEEASVIADGGGPAAELPETRNYAEGEEMTYVPVGARVREVVQETRDVVTLVVETPDGYSCRPGQFNMLSLPAIGEVPISVSAMGPDVLDHTVRRVGAVTSALADLRPGATVGLRGPFGRGWPLEEARGRRVVVVAGGIGLAPLRGAVREMAARPRDYPAVRVLYGTRSPDDIIFDTELLGWVQSTRLRAHVTVDRGPRSWTGNVGVVTSLMRRKRLPGDAWYFLCGPEVMMRFALAELGAAGVPSSQIFLSMERNMKCAAGMCGRCQYGPHFVCKDGPVFRYDEVAEIFGRPGF